MLFCSKCGRQIADGTKFCPECGVAVAQATANIGVYEHAQSQRKQSFEGEIRRCPNCGEVLNAFESVCTACGHELRGTRTSSATREFSEQWNLLNAELSADEAAAEEEMASTSWRKKDGKGKKSSEEIEAEYAAAEAKRKARRVAFIQSFPIPNTREDIIEFLILASSNIKPVAYSDDEVNSAWVAKFEQAYQKAYVTFGDSPDFARVKEIYTAKKNERNKVKSNLLKIRIALIAGTILCLGLTTLGEEIVTVGIIGLLLCLSGLIVAFIVH